MRHRQRPNRRDWIVAILTGAGLGLVFLGIGSRIGMRVVAVQAGQPGTFTLEGSIAVTLLGASAGAAVGAVFALSRALFPSLAWARFVFFWGVTVAIMLRGLNPVTPFKALVFLPLLVVHGVMLQLLANRELREGADGSKVG